MKRILSLVFVLSLLFSCQKESQRPVNLISPSGLLLAKNTYELKKIIKKTNNEISDPDDITVKKIFYDEEDSVTVAKISYSYNGQDDKLIIYMNKCDSCSNQILLENRKLIIIKQKNHPAVIIITNQTVSNDTE